MNICGIWERKSIFKDKCLRYWYGKDFIKSVWIVMVRWRKIKIKNIRLCSLFIFYKFLRSVFYILYEWLKKWIFVKIKRL